jgi:hypothetical protein
MAAVTWNKSSKIVCETFSPLTPVIFLLTKANKKRYNMPATDSSLLSDAAQAGESTVFDNKQSALSTQPNLEYLRG